MLYSRKILNKFLPTKPVKIEGESRSSLCNSLGGFREYIFCFFNNIFLNFSTRIIVICERDKHGLAEDEKDEGEKD